LMTCFTLIIDIEKENKKPCTIKKEDTEKLEKEIDQYEAELPPLKTFLIPGERINSAYYNLTRTTCRKVERTMVKLSRQKHVPEDTLKYFNRLSDYFFLISRITDKNNKNDK